ncbi:MAG: hypothetical protein M1822_000417 [Bathelium mastoideum]|nr:MAG: hypothetical protein M1822_000417 [Bathelium mastoideum]
MTSYPDAPVTGQDQREAQVVTKHLPDGYSAGIDAFSEGPADQSRSTQEARSQNTSDGTESSLMLQGGDIHRDLYKIDAKAKAHRRAATFHASVPQVAPRQTNELSAAEQQAPGGFRRQFVQRKKGKLSRFNPANVPVAKNFVEFLDLYGSFAGEELAESEDESALTDEEEPSETRPLLGRRKSSKVVRRGDAGTTKTFFTLLKAFVGTGIMFLPKAFKNGGILFSSITLVTVSVVTTIAFHLLLQCRKRYGGGYGELGASIGGPKLRALILGSITLSQLGFVCAGTIFVAENLYAFQEAVAQGSTPLSSNALIAIQLVVLIPLALIRNISKLGPAALIADICIMLGLAYIYYYDIATIARKGINPTVTLFNSQEWTLTVGAAIFTFEGIGLILPIQSSMQRPEKFELLLCIVMAIITVIFTMVGVLCYATFGSDTMIEIISNYPQDSHFVNSVQFLYSLAVLVGTPVQLFPAIRIIEEKLFRGLSGKRDGVTKWKKNGFRTAITVACILVSIAGAKNLDRFVALIGSFACVPLVYIYPALLHYKGMAKTRWEKTGDVIFMVVGFAAMVYTTFVTIVNSFLHG